MIISKTALEVFSFVEIHDALQLLREEVRCGRLQDDLQLLERDDGMRMVAVVDGATVHLLLPKDLDAR